MEWLATAPAHVRDPKAASCADLLATCSLDAEVAAYQAELLEAVKLYYKERGQMAPPGDVKACKEMGQQYQADRKAELEELKRPAAPPKPVYGTPEFWKAYWAKKRAAGAQLNAAPQTKSK